MLPFQNLSRFKQLKTRPRKSTPTRILMAGKRVVAVRLLSSRKYGACGGGACPLELEIGDGVH
jgi:hypothetical protein